MPQTLVSRAALSGLCFGLVALYGAHHAIAQGGPQPTAANPVELYSQGHATGTSTNPLVVTGGGGGGSSGSVTAAGTNGTLAQGVQGIQGGVPVSTTSPAAGLGTDSSETVPTKLTQLAAGTVVHAGQLYVMNESAATIQLWLQGATVPILIAAGAGANNQGGDWAGSLNMPWFVGTYTINGAAGAQEMSNAN